MAKPGFYPKSRQQ